jgi:hypothetical protein
MRRFLVSFFAVIGCGDDGGDSTFDSGGGSSGDNDGSCQGFGCTQNEGGVPPGCVGLQCSQFICDGQPQKTTLTGKVYDPAGKVPLYNVVVYVPNGDVAPITPGLGAACDRCDGKVSGNPIAVTLTDASGSFKLENVPGDTDFPLVMQIGKWRRKVTIPKVPKCTTGAADAGITRLPKNRNEGDIPRIALATGSADPLECLLKKIGLDASEFGTKDGDQRIHFYVGGATEDPQTAQADKATAAFKAGGNFAAATGLWSNLAELKKYDIVMLSCEGGELQTVAGTSDPNTKSAAALQALYDYAAVGGRVFTSHYHHYWFSHSAVADVKGIATWANDYSNQPGASTTFIAEPSKATTVNATINTAFPKGAAMKEWLKNTGGLTGPGETMPLQELRHNVTAVTQGKALSWITAPNPAANQQVAHEYVTFNTPVGVPDDQVCGRVVYSDLHVGSGDTPGPAFPDGCTTPDLSPQQKALEFMIFDLSSCVQKDDKPPEIPK